MDPYVGDIFEFTGKDTHLSSVSKVWRLQMKDNDRRIIEGAYRLYPVRKNIVGDTISTLDTNIDPLYIYDLLYAAIIAQDSETVRKLVNVYSGPIFINWYGLVNIIHDGKIAKIIRDKIDILEQDEEESRPYKHLSHIIAIDPVYTHADFQANSSTILNHSRKITDLIALHRLDLILGLKDKDRKNADDKVVDYIRNSTYGYSNLAHGVPVYTDDLYDNRYAFNWFNKHGYLDQFPIIKAIVDDDPIALKKAYGTKWGNTNIRPEAFNIYEILANRIVVSTSDYLTPNILVKIMPSSTLGRFIIHMDAVNIFKQYIMGGIYDGDMYDVHGKILKVIMNDRGHKVNNNEYQYHTSTLEDLLGYVIRYGSENQGDWEGLLDYLYLHVDKHKRNIIMRAFINSDSWELVHKYINKDNALIMAVMSIMEQDESHTNIPMQIYRLLGFKGIVPEYVAYYAENIGPVYMTESATHAWLDILPVYKKLQQLDNTGISSSLVERYNHALYLEKWKSTNVYPITDKLPGGTPPISFWRRLLGVAIAFEEDTSIIVSNILRQHGKEITVDMVKRMNDVYTSVHSGNELSPYIWKAFIDYGLPAELVFKAGFKPEYPLSLDDSHDEYWTK